MSGAAPVRVAGRIQPTPVTQALWDQVVALRAEKFTHPWLSPEWLRLGHEICKVSEQIRKAETEGRC